MTAIHSKIVTTPVTLGFLGIDHPAAAARDVQKLSDWYCEFLGYGRWFRQEDAGSPDRAATDFVWMLEAPDGSLSDKIPAIGGGWVRSARDGEGTMIQLLERKNL